MKTISESEPENSTPALAPKEGFKFGCDPELFVVDSKDRPVYPYFIPGTKEKPHKVEGGAVQRDGFAAEFNIDPATTFDEFNGNIVKVMGQMKTFLPKDHKFHIVPSIEFPEEEFLSAPAEARELGCSPDFDAWTGHRTAPPCCDDRPLLRCAGGHLHFGWRDNGTIDDPQHILNCRDLVKQLDWYLGGWSISVDKDKDRRLLYGKAGAFRPKDYGVEYRSLSNFWITSKDRRLVVWNRMQQAIFDMRRRFAPDNFRNGWNEKLIEAINSSDLTKDLRGIARYPLVTIQQTRF